MVAGEKAMEISTGKAPFFRKNFDGRPKSHRCRDGGGYVASDGNNAGEEWSQQWKHVGDGYDEDDGNYDD